MWDRPGVLAVGPAALQVGRTINVVVVWTGKSEIIIDGRFER
jgi:hypothetical protein